ncbi:MAG: hypothetical protein J6T10_18885 [Methanobrevibacter sp.]|nr:hypothetical protein [Methanobrevibacter sp.]
MKVYAVVQRTHDSRVEIIDYFSSRQKAMDYVIALMKDCPARGYDKAKAWYNAYWEYDSSKLFDVKNWNKYRYVNKTGNIVYFIEAIPVR